MNYITHGIGGIGAGLLVLTVAGQGLNETSQVLITSGAVLGSLFPDIDHQQSYIAHKVPVASFAASTVFKHRGFLHSPAFIILAWILLTAGSRFMLSGELLWMANQFITGFIPGMLSHIILDTLNKQGIPWLWPYKKRFRLLSIRTDSIMETTFAIVLTALIGYRFIQ
ncbi:MAG: metal-dependent hydrolase [Eubacteriales bacterium]|nr:metal-dependent hydrolase [Eubacteriales bacterium]